MLIAYLLAHPEETDKLLRTLDGIAKSKEPYEYGLPTHSEEWMASLREAVVAWLSEVSGRENDGK